MRHLHKVIAAFAFAGFAAVPLAAETMADMFPGYVAWLDPSFHEPFGKMEVHRGSLSVPGGAYTLELGKDFYALTGPDAAWVNQTLWQNLPIPEIEALLFQTGTTPIDDSWAVMVTSNAFGHISDAEAAKMDYQAIVNDRIAVEPDFNRQRREAGLPELTTIGLAGTPGYDAASHALTFSVLLRSSGYDGEILNADAWVLSRHGFVQMTVLGDASHADAVDKAMPRLVSLVRLNEGNRYEDFVPGADTIAEGGLSALLGGGATQAGLIVVALALLKKFGVLLLVPLIWVVNRLRGKAPEA
jgi:uncharacterized membrane-anchored protein